MRGILGLITLCFFTLILLAGCQGQSEATEEQQQQKTDQEKKAAKKEETEGKKFIGIVANVEPNSIDVEKKDKEGNTTTKTFTVNEATEVLIGSKAKNISKITTGMKVTIAFEKDGDELIALKITAKKVKSAEE